MKAAYRRLTRAMPVALALGSLALLTHPTAAVAQSVYETVTDTRMDGILKGMGFETTLVKAGSFRFELNGYKVLMLLGNDNTDAQLYIGFGDMKVSPSKMNEWNKGKRFCRAYMDDDGNPVLESDLDFTGGVTEDAIKAWIKLYRGLLKSYIEFLNK